MKRAFDLNDCLGGELIEMKAARMAEPEVVEEVVEAKVEEAEVAEAEAAEEEEAGCATPNPNDVLPPQFAALVALITQTETESDELEGGGATPDPNDVLPAEYGALAALINSEAQTGPEAVAVDPKAIYATPRRWGGGGASPGLLREEGGVHGYMKSLKQ